MLERITFNWDPVTAVKKQIDRWHLFDCNTEKDFERSLCAFLKSRLRETSVVPQNAFGRHKADLLVNGNVIVEIKSRLKSTAEYQRLIGQLDQYKRWDGSVIVLLVGQWDANRRIELKRWIGRDWSSKFHLIVKETE